MDFSIVKELLCDVFLTHGEFRGEFILRVATTDDDFLDEFAQTSFIAHGTPSDEDSIEIFAINPESRDAIAPVGTSPLWKAFMLNRLKNERFTILGA